MSEDIDWENLRPTYYGKYNWWEVPFPHNDVRPLDVTHTVEVEDE